MGFELEDSRLQRAGLDYHEWASITGHDSIEDFMRDVHPDITYAVSTHGQRNYSDVDFDNDSSVALIFGPETRGLPATMLNNFSGENILRIPMQPDSRSLNLSNAVAIIVYEILRQQQFRNLSG